VHVAVHIWISLTYRHCWELIGIHHLVWIMILLLLLLHNYHITMLGETIFYGFFLQLIQPSDAPLSSRENVVLHVRTVTWDDVTSTRLPTARGNGTGVFALRVFNVLLIQDIFFLRHKLRFPFNTTLQFHFRSRTTIVWPFFVYSKMAMFQAKNRSFRVIQHYEHHIYSESLHQKQSLNKIKMICHASISKINFI